MSKKKKKPSRKAPKKKAARRRPKKAKAKKASRRRRPKAKKAAKKAARRRRPKKAKAKKASRRRRPKKMKAAKKAARRRRPKKAAKKKMSRRSSAAARAMGMMKGARKNPAGILDFLKGEARDMMAIAPSVAVQLGSMAAIGYASAKASEQIKKRVAADGAMHKYAGAISSGAITIAAFAAMKMVKSEKARQFTLPVLFGGMAATLVQVLAAVKVEPKKIEGQPAPATPLPKISLGQRLGLPIGDYMALSGFVDVHGRPVAVNGMGDYVPQALGEIELSRGPYSEGTVVTPMGDYVPQALGELTLHEGRFHEGTVLGEIGQMSEGRQGARALNSPGDLTIESFVDSGSLSGSVFD
jgi:hypothetical protein